MAAGIPNVAIPNYRFDNRFSNQHRVDETRHCWLPDTALDDRLTTESAVALLLKTQLGGK